jgi:hypothetical protein
MLAALHSLVRSDAALIDGTASRYFLFSATVLPSAALGIVRL